MSQDFKVDPLNNQAIEAAISGQWGKALQLNLDLTEKYPNEVELYNRLAKAYVETGQLEKAIKSYKSALKIDPYNPIATKNVDKLKGMNPQDLIPATSAPISPTLFLEEPGKTKIVEIEDVAMSKVISNLKIGDKLRSESNRDTITVLTPEKVRVGILPTSISGTVANAMRNGCKFEFIVKSFDSSADKSQVSLFIKETAHSEKMIGPVFPIVVDDLIKDIKEEPADHDAQPERETSSIDEQIAENIREEADSTENLTYQKAEPEPHEEFETESNMPREFEQMDDDMDDDIDEDINMDTELPGLAKEAFGDNDTEFSDEDKDNENNKVTK